MTGKRLYEDWLVTDRAGGHGMAMAGRVYIYVHADDEVWRSMAAAWEDAESDPKEIDSNAVLLRPIGR